MGNATSKDGWLTNVVEFIPFGGAITAPFHFAAGNDLEGGLALGGVALDLIPGGGAALKAGKFAVKQAVKDGTKVGVKKVVKQSVKAGTKQYNKKAAIGVMGIKGLMKLNVKKECKKISKEHEEKQGNKTAIIIGIDYRHRNAGAPIKGDDGNWLGTETAFKLRDCLIDTKYFEKEDILMFTEDSNNGVDVFPPSKTEILKALDEVVDQAKSGDVILFYFYGHGGPLNNGANHYILTLSDDLKSKNSTRDEEIAKILKRLPTKVNFTMIINSCYSGGMCDDKPFAPKPAICMTAVDGNIAAQTCFTTVLISAIRYYYRKNKKPTYEELFRKTKDRTSMKCDANHTDPQLYFYAADDKSKLEFLSPITNIKEVIESGFHGKDISKFSAIEAKTILWVWSMTIL